MSMTVTVDPGTSGTAWAIWEDSLQKTLCAPIVVGQILGGTGEWLDKLHKISNSFFEQLRIHDDIRTMRIEWPRFMESEGGQKSANSGALVKLSATTGALIELAQQLNIEVVLVEVNNWKGQLSKENVERRVRKRLGDDWCNANLKGEHMYHAVGIGLNWKGFF